jgi:hypothetical protein
MTARMRKVKLRDFSIERRVDGARHETMRTQRIIGSLGTTDQRGITVTFLELQKNRTERRKTNPTITNSLEMIFGKVGIAVRSTHNILDMLPNERTKMRGDGIKRNAAWTTPMKLEQSANNNTESIQSPNETRRPAKIASINSSKRTSIHNVSDE